MRIGWTIVIGLGLAGVALAADPAKDSEPQATQEHAGHRMEAAPHVDVTLAALGAGKSFASGLEKMSETRATYDVAHAGIFVRRIGQDIGLADEHLGHLAREVKGKPEAEAAVKEARTHLKNARTQLGTIEPKATEPQKIARTSESVWKELDQAEKGVAKAAEQIGVEGTLETP